ncbi:MAG: O-antigen ligase family protein [Actinomycetaceae bacterium]|nr:O-antigen ligase family protein [Actinomycetaceae bacterium]
MSQTKSLNPLALATNPIYCVSVYFAFLLLNQVQLLNRYLGGIQVGLVAWAAIVVLTQIFTDRQWLRTKALWVFALLLPVAAVTLAINSELSPFTQLKSAVLLGISIFLAYPLGARIARSPNHYRDLAVVLLPAIVITFLQALVSLITVAIRFSYLGPINGELAVLGVQFFKYNSGAQALIVFGFNADSNHAALFSLISIVLSVWFLIYRNQFALSRRGLATAVTFAWFNLFILIPAFVLHNSRGSRWTLYLVIVLFIPLAVHLLSRTKRRRVLRTIVALVAAFVVVSGINVVIEESTAAYVTAADRYLPPVSEPQTDEQEVPEEIHFAKGEAAQSARPIIWKETFEVWQTSPVFGVGPYNAPAIAKQHHIGDPETGYLIRGTAVHNSYLDVLVAYGLAGIAVYALFFLWAFVVFLKRLKTAPFDTEDLLFLVIIVGILGGTFFLTSIFLGFEYLFGVLLILMGYVVSKLESAPVWQPELVWHEVK